jgi:hypothetical protein
MCIMDMESFRMWDVRIPSQLTESLVQQFKARAKYL